MKRTIAAIAVLFLSAVSLHAQAFNFTRHIVDTQFGGVTAHIGCAEPVALAGVIHAVFHQTVSSKDNMMTREIHIGPRGDVQAIGMLTGNKYNVVGQTFERFQMGNNVMALSFVSQFNVVGLYSVKFNTHVKYEINPDGSLTPTVLVDTFTGVCP